MLILYVKLDIFTALKKSWVMLTCTLKTHVKVSKNRKIVLNDTYNLMHRVLNTSQYQ
jgi:hypothetical protein